MKRLAVALLAIALLAAPLLGVTQPPGKVYRIGYLIESPSWPNSPYLGAFLGGMYALGYVEGQNLVIEHRSAHGEPKHLPELAAGLARLKVDVILTAGGPAIRAALEATKTIPIVMATGPEPVETGLALSLARPGGNLTGLTHVVTYDIEAKRLEILREAVPSITRVALLYSSASSPRFRGQPFAVAWQETVAAAQTLRVALVPVLIDRPAELPAAFAALAREPPVDALFFSDSAALFSARAEVANFAAQRRLPTIGAYREFAGAGGLLSYGTDIEHLFRRASVYVDRILKGARPGDLPIERATKFELVVNLKTAKALGLTIPPSVLARADEVIQ